MSQDKKSPFKQDLGIAAAQGQYASNPAGPLGAISGFLGKAAGPLGIGLSLATGIFGAIKARKEEKRAARRLKKERAKMQELEDIYANLDTSNPYLNLENTMEDLTVNQKQAEFERQSFQQSQANIMSNLRGAAGSSGIAALAQSLAQQGQIASQKQATSIGQQEAANERARAQQAGQIQLQERQGEIMSRDLKRDQTSTLLGMAQQKTAAAAQQKAAAEQAKWGAITGTVTGALGMIPGFGDSGAFKPGGIQGTQGHGTGNQGGGTSTGGNNIPIYDAEGNIVGYQQG